MNKSGVNDINVTKAKIAFMPWLNWYIGIFVVSEPTYGIYATLVWTLPNAKFSNLYRIGNRYILAN